jgi:hypothetical protein
MRMTWLCSFLMPCFCGILFSQCITRGSEEVQLLEIAPQWDGSDRPSKTTVIIRNVNGMFRRTGNGLEGEAVDEVSVKALIRAMQEPAMPAPEMANLGITEEWLAQRVGEQTKSTGTLGEENDERQQEYFRHSFTDLKLVQKLLPAVVASGWTDDYPWVHISVVFSDGAKWTAETNEQPPFMLPWACKAGEGTVHTYNANISRAASELLPVGTVNRDRLAGVGMERLIRQAVEATIKTEWQRIGAEGRAGDALGQLQKRYKIRRSEVSDHHGLTYGAEWKEGAARETYLQADVFLASFPKNLVVATAFPIRDGRVQGLDTFLSTGGKYESLVLTNPWLMRSLRAHADLGAWLDFSEGASLSEKAMRVFSADMHEIGRDDLAKQVSEHRAEVALLNYYGNELILFQDHRAIVWRWDASRELFKWPASSLKGKRCTDYNTLNVDCVAGIIRPDGGLQ